MKKIVVMMIFVMNFVIVKGTLDLDYNLVLKDTFNGKELNIWFAFLALGVFGLFSLEMYKRGKRKKVEGDHIIDYYA